MDSSDNHRSRIPVAVNVASDGEPVDCNGFYTAINDGFMLEFSAGENKYVISHADDITRLESSGLLCYSMDFSAGGSFPVGAVFGDLELELVPRKRRVCIEKNGVDVELEYSLVGGAIQSDRTVKVTARFLS